MTETEEIKRYLKEAETYQRQGLLVESKEKYAEVLKIIEKSQRFSNDQKLILAINGKIRRVEKSLEEVDEATPPPVLSQDLQNLIKKLFTFSQSKEAAALEGAIALAKFGQVEQALIEFQKLLEEGILPVVTAKNILRCYLNLRAPEAAAAQFKKWISRDTFSHEDLSYLRSYLQSSIEKQGVKIDIPDLGATPYDAGKAKKKEEETIDISTVNIPFEEGRFKGQIKDFDVDFQFGNTLSLILPASEKDLIEAFKPGSQLREIQCYSAITVFRARGVVSGKATIKQGPRKGDYMVDITIEAN